MPGADQATIDLLTDYFDAMAERQQDVFSVVRC
jgi:hypothetical protein